MTKRSPELAAPRSRSKSVEKCGLAGQERKRLGLGAPEASKQLLARELQFRRDHRRARVRFALGDRGVVFPAGTYEAFRLYGAHRAPPPASLVAA